MAMGMIGITAFLKGWFLKGRVFIDRLLCFIGGAYLILSELKTDFLVVVALNVRFSVQILRKEVVYPFEWSEAPQPEVRYSGETGSQTYPVRDIIS